jgi:muramoyltetrapeptide carboxypeptidase
VLAPASAPFDPSATDRGVEALRAHGLEVIAPPERARYGHLSATDAERLADLNEALRDPHTDAILCVRGGYGTLRLLKGVDYAAARAHAPLVVGYSDITALQLALLRHADLPSLSGPMVAVEWGNLDAASADLFWKLAQGATVDALLGPAGEQLAPMRPGHAEGRLIGGNLALVTRLLGTPYLPDLDGAILFFEEVGESPYRLDGMLAHLALSGALDRIGGLVVGQITEADPQPGRPSLTTERVLHDHLGGLDIPVATGLVYGHVPVKNTLPIGVRARLEVTADAASLALLEPVTRRAS